jgi:hypothetical protein
VTAYCKPFVSYISDLLLCLKCHLHETYGTSTVSLGLLEIFVPRGLSVPFFPVHNIVYVVPWCANPIARVIRC